MEDKAYTLDYLADTFGINIKIINNWVAAGRFRDMDRENDKEQVRIPASALFLLISGEEIAIQKAIDRYSEIQRVNEIDPSKIDEAAYNILRTIEVSKLITFFEERYNGPFEVVLEDMGDPFTTDSWQWCREGKEWRSLLLEVKLWSNESYK
ncbi:hypothetical protein [Paenibacillus sp. FSL P4-0502]|uniref:hypothetical protein n=1 Tax=Paenibacillus sp. FSL P4-0502 TaxID=2975319 RepID=UPI0030FAD29D